MADKDKDGSIDIRNKITEVMTNNSFKKEVEKMHAHISNYKNDLILENFIENSLGVKNKITLSLIHI